MNPEEYDLPDGNLFVVSWDNLGLEAVIPIKEMLHEELINTLKTGTHAGMQKVNQTINMMMLRARVNSQRHYEIYSITTTEDITADDLKQMFEDNPQGMADLVRERGNELYSNRMQPDSFKIV